MYLFIHSFISATGSSSGGEECVRSLWVLVSAVLPRVLYHIIVYYIAYYA